MTKNKVLIPALFLILFAGSMQLSYAVPEDKTPTLEQKCSDEGQANKPLSPDCELLQIINNLEEELKEKDMELMDKDAELMAKDMELMDKDTELMNQGGLVNDDMVRLCENVDVTESAFMIVGTATVDLLNGINNIVLIPVENNIVSPVRDFDPSFTVNNVIPDVDFITTEILGIDVIIGLEISFDDLNVNLPQPFAAIPNVPTIPGNTINTVDETLNDLEDCQNF